MKKQNGIFDRIRIWGIIAWTKLWAHLNSCVIVTQMPLLSFGRRWKVFAICSVAIIAIICLPSVQFCAETNKPEQQLELCEEFTPKHADMQKHFLGTCKPKNAGLRLTPREKREKTISDIVPSVIEFGTIGAILIILVQLLIQNLRLTKLSGIATRTLEHAQFKNAVEHLGGEKQAVVLGGVYALNNLARSNRKEYGRTVFEVLCSFVREETKKDIRKDKAGERTSGVLISPESEKLSISLNVVQTIINRLFRRGKESLSLYGDYYDDTNLRYAFLRGVDLSCAIMNNPNNTTKWADLRHTDLLGVDLQGADLQKARLDSANLQRANLRGAKLQKSHLTGADLRDADLRGANLRGVNLQGTDLQKVKLLGIQSKDSPDLKDLYLEVINNNSKPPLKPDYSGITLRNDDGSEITEERDKEMWFQKRGADVGSLSYEDVLKLATELGYVNDFESPTH